MTRVIVYATVLLIDNTITSLSCKQWREVVYTFDKTFNDNNEYALLIMQHFKKHASQKQTIEKIYIDNISISEEHYNEFNIVDFKFN